jgi:hypothetical protein
MPSTAVNATDAEIHIYITRLARALPLPHRQFHRQILDKLRVFFDTPLSQPAAEFIALTLSAWAVMKAHSAGVLELDCPDLIYVTRSLGTNPTPQSLVYVNLESSVLRMSLDTFFIVGYRDSAEQAWKDWVRELFALACVSLLERLNCMLWAMWRSGIFGECGCRSCGEGLKCGGFERG